MVARAGLFSLLLSLPVVIVFVTFGHEILNVMYGDSYAEAYLPLLALAGGFAVVNVIGPSMQLLYATAYEKDALTISLLSLIAITVLSVVWIPTHGALGAALTFAIGKTARAIAFRIWAHRRLNQAFSLGVTK
jgi:O-antigen/teichoic acid export membrane protein